jgi:hypothetical protein
MKGGLGSAHFFFRQDREATAVSSQRHGFFRVEGAIPVGNLPLSPLKTPENLQTTPKTWTA